MPNLSSIKSDRPSEEQKARQLIPVKELVELTTNFVFGRVLLTSAQIRGVDLLLKKAMPDLQAIQHQVDGGLDIHVLKVQGHEPDKKPAAKNKPGKK